MKKLMILATGLILGGITVQIDAATNISACLTSISNCSGNYAKCVDNTNLCMQPGKTVWQIPCARDEGGQKSVPYTVSVVSSNYTKGNDLKYCQAAATIATSVGRFGQKGDGIKRTNVRTNGQATSSTSSGYGNLY